MPLRGKQTDHARRMALQIAVQLPEDRDEARAVLRETEGLLDGYLIRGPRELALPTRDFAAAGRVELGINVAAFWTALLFLALSPPAVGLAHAAGVRTPAAYIFTVGAMVAATVFGRCCGLAFVALASGCYNLFVVDPFLQLSWPIAAEMFMLAGNVVIVLLLPSLVQNRERLRRGAVATADALEDRPGPAARSQG